MWRQLRDSVDLLMTDLVLPGVADGKQPADQLKAEKPGLKVILSTGYGQAGLQKELALGADVRFLAKPYDPWSLLELLRDCLNGH